MFVIEPYTGINKKFKVRNNELNIEFEFNYDDVDHDRIDFVAQLVQRMLNDKNAEMLFAVTEFDRTRKHND